jgi:[acyl-carrier-protein] S-malonyltransferase
MNDSSAFVFPGVAVEPCGAEAVFFNRHRAVMGPFLARASEAAGTDLAAALDKGELAGLGERNGQLFTVAYSHAVARVHAEAGIAPRVMAGYSLGVYAALSASGAVAFDECLLMAGAAFDIMKKHCGGGRFAMGAVIGLTAGEIELMLAADAYKSVCRTNTNNPACHVFSGEAGDMERFFDDARGRGALSTVAFGVSIPYHHPRFIGAASKEFFDALGGISWKNASVPVLSSIDQKPLVRGDDLRRFTATNLATPVNWQRVAEAMAALGVGVAYECGPGISLCQNGRFLGGGMRYLTVKKLAKRERT